MVIPIEIENEAKCLISKNHYDLLLTYFEKSFNKDAVKQMNFYYDNVAKDIRFKLTPGSTLRNRLKKEKENLEFKLKDPAGPVEEFKTALDAHALDTLRKVGLLPAGNVSDKLKELEIHPPFKNLGYISTMRVVIENSIYKDAVIMLDASTFFSGYIDWEIEVESGCYEYSIAVRDQILHSHNIPLVPTISKIERLYKIIDAIN